jgi:RNA polymerase sigma factor (sigma-70 family)
MTTMTLPATDPQTATPDGELLRQYGSAASQEAFAEIVRRHVHTVYTSARRQVRDPAAAEDVTQAVFIVLAGKAKKLDGHGSLAGWLMKTTYFASRDVRKRLARRKRHEQAAAQERAMTGGDITMPQITIPHDETISAELDGALAGLKAVDREAVTLRYLQGKSVAETAAALGVNEPAAAKRISRAVERLRERLARRGITSSSIALAVTLEGLPKFHAPAALVHSAAAATAATAPGGAALAKAVVHAMNWAKIKLAAMVVGAAAAAAATTGGAIALVQHEQTPASPPASIPNPAPAPTPVAAQTPVGAAGPAVGALSNGVSIGVMGVREYPAAGNG